MNPLKMASTSSHAYPRRSYATSDEELDSEFGVDNLDDTEEEEDKACDMATCPSLSRRRLKPNWWLSPSFKDPKAKWVQEWNRLFLFICAVGLFIDPLFFYSLSIDNMCMCLYVDGWFGISVTVLRCMMDALHFLNIWLQVKMARKKVKVGGDDDFAEEINVGGGGRRRFIPTKGGLLFDVFVALPLPQVVLWVVIPQLLDRGSTTTLVMTVFLIIFLVQYLPKIYHSVLLLIRLQNLSGYIFGTAWWGLALNLISYFVASHAVGACWFLLGLQRASECIGEQCSEANGCQLRFLDCKPLVYYGASKLHRTGFTCFENRDARSTCLLKNDAYNYGAYTWVVQLVANTNRVEKILFPLFWGLMTLSTFGNLQSTTHWLELVFNIIVITSGLLLVTMLIGNIKVFLHATTSKKQAMQIKMRNIEWWMNKRRLPIGFRQRVRNYERQRWAAMRGVDESEMISNLPEGLRRDIKYHLCLDLVRQVPLFQHMDDLVLENICDRVKSLIYTKGETIAREGDPVKRMLFVVRGHLQSSQVMRDGLRSCCMLGPGNFSGDELLSWCLQRPFIDILPPSSSTLVTLETTEVFGLDADDVKYVTQHFRYTFLKEKVKRSARYYSPGWRTWAAVTIQLVWKRYKHALNNPVTLRSLSFIRPSKPLSRGLSREEERLKLYTALLTSPKPNENDLGF